VFFFSKVISWFLVSVFEERFSKESVNTVKLVEIGNTLQFAHEAVAVVREWGTAFQSRWFEIRKDMGTGGKQCNSRIK
jgi:hypothetical protein